MGKKSKKNRIGVVYSTSSDYSYRMEQDEEFDTLEESKQKLYVSLDRKNRKGKEVTLVEGFVGTNEDLQALGKLLKSKCGSGGTAKEGEILVQGNHVLKVAQLLLDMGYGQVKKKGGF
jgi:translation initiation factor 1